MANISKVKLPDNNTYLLADENGRKMIATDYATGTAYSANDFVIYDNSLYKITADITAANNTAWSVVSKSGTSIGVEINAIKTAMSTGIHYRGTTTTALADGSTTNPITINGESYTAVAGDLVIYNGYEFLFDGTYWEKFGTDGTLKALAFADTASGSSSVSVTGTASAQTFTGTQATISISGNVSGTAVSMTPSSANQETVVPFGSGGSFTQGTDTFSAGTTPVSISMGTGANAETLIIATGTAPSFSQGSDSFTPASGGSSVTLLKSLPTPSVTQGTFSGSTTYTPEGSNASSSVSASGTVSVTVTPDV